MEQTDLGFWNMFGGIVIENIVFLGTINYTCSCIFANIAFIEVAEKFVNFILLSDVWKKILIFKLKK